MSNATTLSTSQNKKWYIRFDRDSGRILSLGPRPLITTKDTEEITSSTNTVCKELISGKKNLNKYSVHWDYIGEKWDIDVKSSTLELKTKGEKLNQIKEQSPGSCDIFVKVIRATNSIKIDANLASIKNSLNLGQISNIKNDNTSILDIYLCRKNDPDYLIGIIPVDAIRLITDTYLYLEVPSNITRHINSWDDVSFFTKPVFNSYGLEITDVVTVETDDQNERPQQCANVSENSHINIYTLNDKLIIDSNINSDTLYYFENRTRLKIHISDSYIDNYVTTLKLPTSKLVDKSMEINKPDNWPINPILTFKNKQLTINYHGEKNDHNEEH